MRRVRSVFHDVFRVLSQTLFVLLVFPAACVAPPPPALATHPKPPPKPGTSITHSRMCECTVCTVAACCKGDTEDDAPQDCHADETTGEMRCGLAMTSCVGRCSREVWRVPLSKECDEHRPAGCCAG